ncbi:DUF1330 domain-containing protein [Marinobacter panjinensis]|uniref:DUF1330 domain-containing protein n=1 Tax=Marinobacter panjinensis TaxID=2576384 RepID=A0A4V6CV75_9GAMM|nr:DUF1330 domain-containing protein [Marinobacter panjinensis]MCR8915513.1 DUF1330 domain-containing protein [Marinobacter panjinensis]TKV66765.1 DUF1330 domain-containing protein [Marinobacter panjinensis]
MTAYVIGQITIKDPAKWEEYRSKVPDTLAPWRAELVLRGVRAKVLSGKHPHTDTVVIRFPDPESVVNWQNSAAYQALIYSGRRSLEGIWTFRFRKEPEDLSGIHCLVLECGYPANESQTGAWLEALRAGREQPYNSLH